MATADRIAGAAVMAFALALWFIVIPDQVDKADYGWMRPRTLPYILTGALFVLGLLLILTPKDAQTPEQRSLDRHLGGVLALAGFGVFAMGQWGFLIAAPVLTAAAAWLVGERRWPMLGAAGILVPLSIWVLVGQVLGRPLP